MQAHTTFLFRKNNMCIVLELFTTPLKLKAHKRYDVQGELRLVTRYDSLLAQNPTRKSICIYLWVLYNWKHKDASVSARLTCFARREMVGVAVYYPIFVHNKPTSVDRTLTISCFQTFFYCACYFVQHICNVLKALFGGLITTESVSLDKKFH